MVQLNLVLLGTKGNYKEGKELFLAVVLPCKLSCGSWIESGRLRQFSKVRSSKRDFMSIDANFIVVARYVSVKSKLQHAPPPGHTPGI